MRVAVLGAHGFLGRHVVETLVAAGMDVVHPVRAADLPARPVAAGARAFAVSAADESMSTWLRDIAPAAVVDCAWVGVHASWRDDATAQEANVRRIDTLCSDLPPETRTWIGVGSQAEYGPIHGTVPEEHPVRPSSAYGRAKVTVHQILRSRFASQGIILSWLRVFAAYGPHQPPGWLIPDAIAKLLNDEDVVVRNPAQGCDYVYVGDVANAVAAVLPLRTEGVYNVGRGQAVTVGELVALARDVAGSSSLIHAQSGGEDGWWAADVTALTTRTAWRAATGHRAGLEATVRSIRGDGSAAGT
jgi:nucleoside-diphosphate-sugar epimerase